MPRIIAAWPVGENASSVPADSNRTMPSASRVRAASRSSTRQQAAVAPKTPSTEVRNQRSIGSDCGRRASARPRRQMISLPTATAVISRLPSTLPLCSAMAKTAGTTTPLGWVEPSSWPSSKLMPRALAPLAIAAIQAGALAPRPMIVACAVPPELSSSRASLPCPVPRAAPAEATPSVSMTTACTMRCAAGLRSS